MKFVGGDYANIEGRVNAWLAGEVWKIAAFTAYDMGVAPDMYNMSFERSFGHLPNGKEERQLGKIQELALGYQGGVGAYLKFVQTYRMKLENIIEPVKQITSPNKWESVCNEYNQATDKHELFRDQWAAIKILVRNWREAHPAIKQSWYDLDDAVLQSVENKSIRYEVYNGRVQYLCDGNFLYCCLPSGRVISYAQPFTRREEKEWVELGEKWISVDEFWPFEIETMKAVGFKFKKRIENRVWFWGLDGETNQWRPSSLYGGHLCENIVQAASRCILTKGMKQAKAAGYPIIMHSHDEIVAWCEDNFGSKTEFEALMSVKELWLAGCPISVKGWEDKRYMK